MRSPLDHVRSLKVKLGIVIVAAVGVTAVLGLAGARSGLPLWLCGLAAVAVALLMVQFLARGMTAPLREMAAAAGEMAQGRYESRIEPVAQDEVGELAAAFNRMAAELAEVDRERRELIANVSHELRTPISALRAVLENIVDGVEPADPQTLAAMLAQTDRLGRLVTQLLDLSRLEAQPAELDRRAFAVEPLLETALREAMLRPEAAALDLSVRVRPAGLRATGDPERIQQVLANLIENAISHSPAGGGVLLGARADGGGVELEVADEGPGIDAGDAEMVFERFYRAGSARSRDGGTGLGLAIARSIVELHQGRIRAERREPRGCRMVVTLPAGPV